MKPHITTFLMFTGKAEEAMNFYMTLFANSAIEHIERYGPGEQGAPDSVKRASFHLNGQRFMCIDSPVEHAFTFTPSMSLFVDCASETEIDGLFERLSTGGEILMPLDAYPFSAKFGWINDRYGVSWQLNLD
jgi:predicted 3-demethylubiquinone-9 3-methyltransferase (glyoxalase superfamily)